MSTLAVVSTLVASCHIVMSPAQVARLSDYADVESGGNTLAINVNCARGTVCRDAGERHAATLEEAVAIASRLVAAGRSVDLGLLQINSAHLGEPGMPATVAEAMEPCTNIRAGVAILAAADRQSACIYNTGRPGCTNGYPEKIQAAAAWRLPLVTTGAQSAAASSAQPAPKPQSEDIDLFAEARARPSALLQTDDK
jgi:type IV secretion system protein VirB1